MTFQRIVLIIAGILLIITLAIIGLLIKAGDLSSVFPPELGQCPDYFKTTMRDGKLTCKRVHDNLGTCEYIDIGDATFRGDNGAYNKCMKAKSCSVPPDNVVTWDGITNRQPALC